MIWVVLVESIKKNSQRNVLKRKKPYEELKRTHPLTGQKAKEKAEKGTSIKYLRYMKRSPMKSTKS